jgi:hypothetical protein
VFWILPGCPRLAPQGHSSCTWTCVSTPCTRMLLAAPRNSRDPHMLPKGSNMPSGCLRASSRFHRRPRPCKAQEAPKTSTRYPSVAQEALSGHKEFPERPGASSRVQDNLLPSATMLFDWHKCVYTWAQAPRIPRPPPSGNQAAVVAQRVPGGCSQSSLILPPLPDSQRTAQTRDGRRSSQQDRMFPEMPGELPKIPQKHSGRIR